MSGWIEYDSNNSGGSFWLGDQDWRALEGAGWHVQWNVVTCRDMSKYGGDKEYVDTVSGRVYSGGWENATRRREPGEPLYEGSEQTVVAWAASYEEAVALRDKHGGYFGTLAVSAVKRGDSPDDLVAEFERVTGQRASDLGCSCCGPPHNFEWHDDDGTTRHASAQVVASALEWS